MPPASSHTRRRLFCCLGGKLTATDFSFAAEILGRRRSGDNGNSQQAGCSAAVIGCSVKKLGYGARSLHAGDNATKASSLSI
jgi:hypothetical protein